MHIVFKVQIRILNIYMFWCWRFQASCQVLVTVGLEPFTICINLPCYISAWGLYRENVDLIAEEYCSLHQHVFRHDFQYRVLQNDNVWHETPVHYKMVPSEYVSATCWQNRHSSLNWQEVHYQYKELNVAINQLNVTQLGVNLAQN